LSGFNHEYTTQYKTETEAQDCLHRQHHKMLVHVINVQVLNSLPPDVCTIDSHHSSDDHWKHIQFNFANLLTITNYPFSIVLSVFSFHRLTS